MAVTKAYKQLDDEWYDYSPRKAVEVLELAPEDYKVDEERSALLLRRLPPGLRTWAREVLQTPSPCQQSANTGELSSGNTRPDV